MKQLCAYFSSIANTAADQQISALVDNIIPTRDSAFVVPKRMSRIILSSFFGVNLTVATFKPPSWRQKGDYSVLPMANAVGGAGGITPYLGLTGNYGDGPPLELDPQEELPAYGQQGSAGAQDAYACVLFSDEAHSPVKGHFFTVRATGTTTLTAKAWSQVTLTMDLGLPKGQYRLVGARVKSATGLFFRFSIPEQNERPGGLCNQDILAFEPIGQRNGGWGDWGHFDHLSIPILELIATAADTAETVWFDLEQIG